MVFRMCLWLDKPVGTRTHGRLKRQRFFCNVDQPCAVMPIPVLLLFTTERYNTRLRDITRRENHFRSSLKPVSIKTEFKKKDSFHDSQKGKGIGLINHQWTYGGINVLNTSCNHITFNRRNKSNKWAGARGNEW